ncbi:MAG TPA: antitoxin [Segeticoccus sp.]|uniref:antitoxin n=1 Tax=Segeticoccus sp. TaxID=2706531 RepID=UPI002D8053BB|nr:antitoxin [Segeticoccus sp.]HET8602079.1 antitoxin [Segeticoccus sp.]
MSFLDKAKQMFGQARTRAGELADEHGDKIDQAIDKGGSFLDERTKGKYSDTINKVSDGAKGAADRIAEERHHEERPPTPPEPASHLDTPDPVDPPEPIEPPEPLDPRQP